MHDNLSADGALGRMIGSDPLTHSEFMGDLHVLLTSHGTVVFLDAERSELRHGDAA